MNNIDSTNDNSDINVSFSSFDDSSDNTVEGNGEEEENVDKYGDYWDDLLDEQIVNI